CVKLMMRYLGFFFFQAEDGIRDGHVTGVQTCALPISQAVVGGHACGETLASRVRGVPMDSLSRRWAPLSPVSSHTTVGEKPDEYWWEDHVPTRLYLAPRSCSWRLEGTSGRIGQVNSQGGNLV